MNKIIFILFVVAALFLTGCKSFVPKEKKAMLMALENYTYVMKKDAVHGKNALKQGNKVKVIIMPQDDWIKVYAYPADKDKLTAPRVLVVYIFEDDFKKGIYDFKILKKEFDKVLKKTD